MLVFAIMLFAFLMITNVRSQTAFQLFTPIPSSSALLYENANTSPTRIGLGIPTPDARFHILSSTDGLLYIPMFKSEVSRYGVPDGFISFMKYEDIVNPNGITETIKIGIYQNGQDYVNFFQGKTKFQKRLYFTHNNEHINGIVIENDDFDDVLTFTFSRPYSLQPEPPLTIDPMLGVTTHGLLSCDNFKMTVGAVANSILIGDAEGIGTWADASNFHDDDWLISTVGKTGTEPPPGEMRSIYFNALRYKNVGIGTDRPFQKLHIMDGNILISRSPSDAPGSLNGSILFGEVASNTWPLGEWGIEYYNEGLNFWKVESESNRGANYCLFLKNNGHVGVGTELPLSKFQVNAGFEKLSIGSANYPGLGPCTSYIGFNAARAQNNWIFDSDGVHNGGAIIYVDVFGSIQFVNAKSLESSSDPQIFTDEEIAGMSRMTISNTGDIGIGTRNPSVALDVNRNGATAIRSYALGSYASSLWAMNSQGGYGLTVDELGVGHISENALEPQPIISFRNGRVGIGCEDFEGASGNHKLFVTGGITTEDIEVKLHGDWYDNVFLKDYSLKSLEELEKYVIINKHLPDIPSESEVRANGINLGEMNALLLKKVEELTLYLIDQQKQINALKEKLNESK